MDQQQQQQIELPQIIIETFPQEPAVVTQVSHNAQPPQKESLEGHLATPAVGESPSSSARSSPEPQPLNQDNFATFPLHAHVYEKFAVSVHNMYHEDYDPWKDPKYVTTQSHLLKRSISITNTEFQKQN